MDTMITSFELREITELLVREPAEFDQTVEQLCLKYDVEREQIIETIFARVNPDVESEGVCDLILTPDVDKPNNSESKYLQSSLAMGLTLSFLFALGLAFW